VCDVFDFVLIERERENCCVCVCVFYAACVCDDNFKGVCVCVYPPIHVIYINKKMLLQQQLLLLLLLCIYDSSTSAFRKSRCRPNFPQRKLGHVLHTAPCRL
jgi:hypothetical protein